MSDRDLFDDTTMSFGEHLEELRTRLIKALLGLVVGVAVGFALGGSIIDEIKRPLVRTLTKYEYLEQAQAADGAARESAWDWLRRIAGLTLFDEDPSQMAEDPVEAVEDPDAGGLAAPPRPNEAITVEVLARELAVRLKTVAPDAVPDVTAVDAEETVTLTLRSPLFAELKQSMNQRVRPVTLTVQEGFFTYLKVSFISGLVFASPWIFWQAWQFVAAGLYPHERKYVYRFGPMSFLLFAAGVAFAWVAVIPFALDFFIGFSTRLGLETPIQIGPWIGFAVLMPVLFGVAFQMPLVMLFLERIGVFDASDYREKRSIAILAILLLSAFLTPQDPITMVLMAVPLTLLYEFGIFMCQASPKRGEFDPLTS